MREDLEVKIESLKNRQALVTGASSGIGRATALQLAREGAHLFLVARREDKLLEVAAFIKKEFGTKVSYVVGDLTHESTWKAMEEKGFFHADIVINNAGLALGRDEVEHAKWSDLSGMLDVNVTASFKLIHRTLPFMMKKKFGDIISIGSIAGAEKYPGGAVYCATKHALKAFCESIRKETYGHNVRVMLISPGMVETEFSLVRFNQDKDKAKAVYAGVTPLYPRDIAQVIVTSLKNPRHMNTDELVLLCTDQGSATLVRRKS